jgi:hypothetical protein
VPDAKSVPQPSDDVLDAIAEAIRVAGCPDRQGPFGLFNYGTHGDAGGAHVVRDFRRGSATYGKGVFASDDSEEARRVYEEMTDRHVARAAWDVVMASRVTLAEDVRLPV